LGPERTDRFIEVTVLWRKLACSYWHGGAHQANPVTDRVKAPRGFASTARLNHFARSVYQRWCGQCTCAVPRANRLAPPPFPPPPNIRT